MRVEHVPLPRTFSSKGIERYLFEIVNFLIKIDIRERFVNSLTTIVLISKTRKEMFSVAAFHQSTRINEIERTMLAVSRNVHGKKISTFAELYGR